MFEMCLFTFWVIFRGFGANLATWTCLSSGCFVDKLKFSFQVNLSGQQDLFIDVKNDPYDSGGGDLNISHNR